MAHQLVRRSIAAFVPILATAALPALDTVTVATAGNTAYEQGSLPAVFELTRTGSSGTLTVNFAVTGTAASDGTDYTALGTSVTFASGSTKATVAVTPVDDAVVEGSETVTLSITGGGPSSYTVGAVNAATITIGDNDIEARMSAPDPSAEEFTQAAGFTPRDLLQQAVLHFALSQTVAGTTFRTLPRTLSFQIGGTATLGTDYDLAYDGTVGARLAAAAATGATSLTISNGANLSTYLATSNYTDITGNPVVPDYVAVTNVRDFYAVSNYSFAGSNGTVTLSSGLLNGASSGTQVKRVTYAVTHTPSAGAARGESSVALAGASLAIGDSFRLVGKNNVAHGVTYTITGSSAGVYSVTPALVESVASGTTAHVTLAAGGNTTRTVSASSTALLGYTASGSTTVDFDNATGAISVGDWVAFNDVDGIYKVRATTSATLTLASALQEQVPDNTRIYRLGADSGTVTNGSGLILTLINNAGSASDVDFLVFPRDDSTPEGRETVAITMIGTAEYQTVTPTVTTATIADNDVLANIAFGSNAGEPGTAGTMTITLSSALPQAVDVPVQVVASASTATLTPGVNADYTIAGIDSTTGRGTITIPANSTSATLTVSPIADTVTEAGGETVTVNLLQSADYWFATAGTSGSNPSATVNIADKEGTVGITVQSSGAREGTGSSTLQSPVFRFTLRNDSGTAINPTQALGVAYTVTGTATASSDFTAVSGNVIIPSTASFVDLTIPILDDVDVEGSESIIVTLATGPGYDVSSTAPSGTVTLLDDEPVIEIAAGVTPTESGTTGTFVVSYDGVPAGTALNRPVTVSYTVKNTSTATVATDYTALSGSVTIAANSRSATVSVVPVDDATRDPGETIIVDVNDGGLIYAASTSDGSATLTITDNEPSLTVSRSIAAAEPATNGVFTITASSAVAGADLIIPYTISGTATAGTDFTAPTGTATIPVGSTTATVTIPIIDDVTTDAGETVILTLTGITGTGSSDSMTITDDEPGLISFSAATATVAEGSTFLVSLTRSGGIKGAASVTVTSASGTATSATDFTAVNNETVSWSDGESGTKTLSFVALSDTAGESDETATLTLGTPAGASPGTTTTMTVTITDIAGGSSSGAQQQVAGVSAGGCGAGLGAAGLMGFGLLVAVRRRRNGAR